MEYKKKNVGFKFHLKTCSSCNRTYKTSSKYSKMCDNCKLKIAMHKIGRLDLLNSTEEDKKIFDRYYSRCKRQGAKWTK